MKLKITTLLLLLSFGFTTIHAQSITDGLVGWWPFTGNAVDSVKMLNNGTVYGATLTTDRFGSSNSAYYFDGNGDYIDIGTHSSLRSSAHSINLWFKYTDTSKYVYLVDNQNGNGGEWGSGILHHPNDGMTFGIGAGSNNHSMGHSSYERLSDDQWHMLTATYDKKLNQLALYLDGSLSGYQNYNGSKGGFNSTDSVRFNSGEHWMFGAHSQYFSSTVHNGPRYFKGSLDDIRMYNRRLSVLDINALFLEGKLNITPGPNFNQVKIYPNPTNQKVTIDLGDNLKVDGHKVTINNSLGQKVHCEDVTSRVMVIDMISIGSAGFYVVIITDKNLSLLAVRKIFLR